MADDVPRFRVTAIDLCERPVTLRLPFRFGIVTLTHAPQAFVRARIALNDGRESDGVAAELMVPKWFDKDPSKSNDDNFQQLRRALALTRDAYTDGTALTAFGHFAQRHEGIVRAAAAFGIPPLAAYFGPALVDRAILDALGRLTGLPFVEVLQRNLPGVVATAIAPDLARFDADAFLAGLSLPPTVAARHTVGLADRLTDDDPGERVDDGLPESLAAVARRYRHRHYKLKVAGNPGADFDRLVRIAAVLDAQPFDYVATLDGNEQYGDVAAVAELLLQLAVQPATARLAASILFVEQPAPRARALDIDVAPLARVKPVIIDESDAALDAFVAARDHGYTGVSSKACKGVYRSLVNAMRCTQWNAGGATARYFLSGEDLTTQAGLAVQQDLALAAAIGVTHVERNGHHYVNGFAGQGAPAAEQQAFLAAHRGLYEETAGSVRLAIVDGRLDIRSLGCTGFASAARPDFDHLPPMRAQEKQA